MKKILQFIGLLTLFIVSFSYNEEVLEVGKITDTLLREIENNALNYQTKKIEATLDKNTIIPGINGKNVDVNKSYNTMKQTGFFDEMKLVYEMDEVENLLIENTDKYIINGNKTKKEIALVFKVDLNDKTNEVLSILKQNNTKATFFVDTTFAQNKNENLKQIMAYGHTIGNLSDGSDYIWLKTLITSMTNQKNSYCVTTFEDNERLIFCDKYKAYTIKVNDIIENTPLIKVKNNLENGKIFYFEINRVVINELSNIERYITSKGYKLVNLETLLQE